MSTGEAGSFWSKLIVPDELIKELTSTLVRKVKVMEPSNYEFEKVLRRVSSLEERLASVDVLQLVLRVDALWGEWAVKKVLNRADSEEPADADRWKDYAHNLEVDLKRAHNDVAHLKRALAKAIDALNQVLVENANEHARVDDFYDRPGGGLPAYHKGD